MRKSSSTLASARASIELIAHHDRLIRDLELFLVCTAKRHDPLHPPPALPPRRRQHPRPHPPLRDPRHPSLPPGPGLRLLRPPREAKESSGKRIGTGGRKIGNVHLKWAFYETAVLLLRNNPEGQRLLQKLQRKHRKAKALSILAHKLGRATYFILQRETAFDMQKFLAA